MKSREHLSEVLQSPGGIIHCCDLPTQGIESSLIQKSLSLVVEKSVYRRAPTSPLEGAI